VPDDSVTYPSTECFSYTIQAENVLSITLASDGAESYHHSAKRLSEDPPSQVEKDTLKGFGLMKRIVAYKNHKGEFVKRRMKKLKQEVEKIQAEHYDDVSCATIWIDHVKES
jgi:phosphoglycolate phosphatase-like HAD superfamily hydrolase